MICYVLSQYHRICIKIGLYMYSVWDIVKNYITVRSKPSNRCWSNLPPVRLQRGKHTLAIRTTKSSIRSFSELNISIFLNFSFWVLIILLIQLSCHFQHIIFFFTEVLLALVHLAKNLMLQMRLLLKKSEVLLWFFKIQFLLSPGLNLFKKYIFTRGLGGGGGGGGGGVGLWAGLCCGGA